MPSGAFWFDSKALASLLLLDSLHLYATSQSSTLPFYKSFIQYHCFQCVYNGSDTNCTVQTNYLHNIYVKVTVHLWIDRVICFKFSTSYILLWAHGSYGLHLKHTTVCGERYYGVDLIINASIILVYCHFENEYIILNCMKEYSIVAIMGYASIRKCLFTKYIRIGCINETNI